MLKTLQIKHEQVIEVCLLRTKKSYEDVQVDSKGVKTLIAISDKEFVILAVVAVVELRFGTSIDTVDVDMGTNTLDVVDIGLVDLSVVRLMWQLLKISDVHLLTHLMQLLSHWMH